MTVHILALDPSAGSLNRHSAHIGFTARGAETRFFAPETFDALDLQEGDIVVGGIGYAHRAMARLGLAPPEIPSTPEKLIPSPAAASGARLTARRAPASTAARPCSPNRSRAAPSALMGWRCADFAI